MVVVLNCIIEYIIVMEFNLGINIFLMLKLMFVVLFIFLGLVEYSNYIIKIFI